MDLIGKEAETMGTPGRRNVNKYKRMIEEAVNSNDVRAVQDLAKEIRDARKAKGILLKKCCNAPYINDNHSLLEIVMRLPHIEAHYKHHGEGRWSHGH